MAKLSWCRCPRWGRRRCGIRRKCRCCWSPALALEFHRIKSAATTTSPVGSRLALGVVLVEVRADGQRGAVMAALLGAGLRYVGELHARGSEANGVIDDVFVNATHLRAHFGESRAARSLAKALGHDEARAQAVK